MKHSILSRIPALLLAICLLIPACAPAEEKAEYLVPDFTLTDQYGETHSLSDYKGKTVLVNFWATWCTYCVQEMPDLEALYHEYGENKEDVVILGIAAPGVKPHDPQVDLAGTVDFLKEQGVTYPVLMDTDGKLFDQYISEGYPTTLLIRPDGYLMYYIPGALSKENFQSAIDATRSAVPAEQK